MTSVSKAQILTESLKKAIDSKNTAETSDILKSMRDDAPAWILSFADAISLKGTIESIPTAFPSDEALVPLAQMVLKIVIDIVLPFEKVSQEWWTDPKAPDSPSIALSFEDATAECLPLRVHDHWDAITIEANLDEDFRTAFLRFRFLGNKRHRHPLLPSLDFDIVVSKDKATLLSSHEAGNDSVKSLLDKLQLDLAQSELVILYVRNDHRNSELQKLTPAQAVPPWKRLLPDWFLSLPKVSSLAWVEPVPPPAYSSSEPAPPQTTQAYKVASYYPVSTLKYAGTGRNILPTNSSPSTVANCIYVPIETYVSPYGISANISGELFNDRAQLVQTEDKMPLPLTDDQARRLLGRIIQYSIEPLPAPTARPKKKSRKSTLTEFVTAAWGYDRATRLLHCVDPSDFLHSSFVIDVSTPGNHAVAAPSTTDAYGEKTQYAHWIGLVSLPEDVCARASSKLAQGSGERAAEMAEPKTAAASGPASALETLQTRIESLNTPDGARIFNVGKPSDALLVGDVQLSKEGLDFELAIKTLTLGAWRVSEPSETEVRLTWMDPDAQSEPDMKYDDAKWEFLGGFSIDAGVGGAFLASAFEEGGVLDVAHGDSMAVLETLMDHILQDPRRVLVVPGGVVFSLGDGGYVVKGRRGADQELVLVQIEENRTDGM